MQSSQIFLENLPGLVLSLAAAALYCFSTLALGRRLAPACRPGWEGMSVAVQFSLGAAALGLILAILAMLGLAFPPLVLAIALLPAAIASTYWLVTRPSRAVTAAPKAALQQPGIDRPFIHFVIAFFIVLIAAYPLAQSLAWPRGGDMAIYHLVIPRSILWNHGLVFNPFSHDAGLYYGWQVYALPAYLMGGDRAFQLCSFAALVILLISTCRTLNARYGMTTGLLGALVVAAVLCGMSRESIVNNDVPLVLLELSLLGLAATVIPGRRAALLLGLLAGFTIAVKLVAVATVALAGLVFAWRCSRPLRAAGLGWMAVGTIMAVAPWPLFNMLSSGSPVAHFLLLWPPDSGYLPHYRESITTLMQYFGDWYRKNFLRLFTRGLEFVPGLIAGYLFMLFVRPVRADPLCVALGAFAVLKILLLIALNRFDAALVFHDRYHLASFVLLVLGGLLCWRHAVVPVLETRPRLGRVILPALMAIAVVNLYRTHVSAVQVNGEGLPDTPTTYPSLKNGFYAAAGRLAEHAGGGRLGVAYDFAAEQLPPDAVIATTVIDPYLLQRRFLQMLPVSENLIDLALPPEQLREALLAHGATHLHLAQHTGLNPWMDPVIERWLARLREVPGVHGVRRLLYLNYPTQKGLQGFYALAPEPPSGPPLRQLDDTALTLAPDGTWIVSWRRASGGDVRVNLRAGGDRPVMLGEAASETGQFPVRLALPVDSMLEVLVLVEGKTVQSVALPVTAAPMR
jgi:hypothetical protein